MTNLAGRSSTDVMPAGTLGSAYSGGGDSPVATGRADGCRIQFGLAQFAWVGLAVLALQLVALLVYSTIEFSRYGLTRDYAYYAQAWYQLAHLHSATTFFRNQGELSFVLLAPSYWLWPHGPILLWIQDIALVASEVVAFRWICDVAGTRRRGPRYLPVLLASAGLVALLADPWIWWTLAWDFHFEVVAVLFAILFARELQKGRRRAWIWGGLTLLSGAVAASYVLAIGLGALIGSRRRLWGAIAIGSGLVWLAALHGFGATSATGDLALSKTLAGRATGARQTSTFSDIRRVSLGLLLHPSRLASEIWSKRLDVFANLASSGIVGVFAPVVLFVLLVVTLENILYPGLLFSQPSFQSIPIYIFGPVGVVMFLVWLAPGHRRLAAVLAVAVMIETIGWGVIWLPRTPGQWIRVPAAAAAELNRFEAAVPADAEVVASQGIEGRFSTGRRLVSIAGLGGSIGLHGRPVWFVLAPNLGVETAPAASENALVAKLVFQLHARPVANGHGIWSYVYTPRAGRTRFQLPRLPTKLPAWLFSSQSGDIVITGPTSKWRVAGTGRIGYLVYGDYWNEPTGPAVATARLGGRGTVTVEVWNATTSTLLAERRLALVGGPVEASVPFEVPPPHRASAVFRGEGPFSVDPIPAPSGSQIEVRVYNFASGDTPVVRSVGVSSSS